MKKHKTRIKKQKNAKVFIYGKHALMEALQNAPQVVDKIFLLRNNDDAELKKAIKVAGLEIGILGSGDGTKKDIENVSHQGVVARVSLEKLIVPFKDFMNDFSVTQDTSVLVLGEVQDPHNVGAIIRSAAAFGVSAVIMPTHNQAPITGAVIKVSAGMAFRIPIVSTSNINASLRDLKDKGFWTYGLDGESKNDIAQEAFDTPTVFVLGNESRGIREKTRDMCDIILSIPNHPQCESLNVAASTAVALYAWSKKHPQSLNK